MNPFPLGTGLGLAEKGIVSIYGAGGKTTLLYCLAAELALAGEKVVLTTTTKMYKPTSYPLILWDGPEAPLAAVQESLSSTNTLMVARGLLPDGKVQGVPPRWAEEIWREGLASYVLVEGDGAARRPIKGYAPHEPVLPPASHLAIPVLGLDALGAMVGPGEVHRAEEFGRLTGLSPGETIGAQAFVKILGEMVRRAANQCPKARIVPCFNKADLSESGSVRSLILALAGSPGFDRVLITALKDPANPVHYIFHRQGPSLAPRVSLVMLAAGSSQRMGQKKLFLSHQGRTILEASLQGALGSRAGEVIVVAPADDAAQMGRMLAAERVKIAVNPRSREGQATSLQAGLAAVDPSAQAVIFALADQPLVTSEVYDSLIETYTRQLKPVVCPVYQGVRGNPVLFDRRLWPSLMNLQGDRGGRQVLSLLQPADLVLMETSCPGVLFDIDTPADYRELVDKEDSCS
jgi:molybdenum cofactor cytidylyltransferase